MQILLAPSKTMTMEWKLPTGSVPSRPYFLKEAEYIVRTIRGYDNLVSLMRVSQSIADRTLRLYRAWGQAQAPAILAYRGDVYRWFYADTLAPEDLDWAQQHLWILSGLYGALRPLDMVSPYRLEMKARLAVGKDVDLYGFWGSKVAQLVDDQPDAVICNLSSDEYARVVTRYTTKRIVTPVFIDNKTDGTVGTVPIYSKMMRGVMARWMIDHRVADPVELQKFAQQGYRYDASKSTLDQPAFFRVTPKPIRFG